MMESIGLSIFHSISSFNNAGLTILTKERSMEMYAEDPFMLILTTALVFVGGLGFIVIRECWVNRFRWRKLSMHSRVSIFMAVFLLIGGAVLLKLTNPISWLVAFFSSQSARSVGYMVYPFESWSPAGLLVMLVLMFIGTSTGSTGGGVKRVLFCACARGTSCNDQCESGGFSLFIAATGVQKSGGCRSFGYRRYRNQYVYFASCVPGTFAGRSLYRDDERFYYGGTVTWDDSFFE